MPRQKLRDAAFILPFFGLILIMPPFVDIFFSTRLLAGIPGILLYIFGVWTLLIVLGALLSRRLATSGDTADTPTPGPPPDPRPQSQSRTQSRPQTREAPDADC